MSGTEIGAICQVGNMCRLAVEDGPFCGSSKFLFPLPLPGKTCINALREQYDRVANTQRAETGSTRGAVFVGEVLLEMGMSPRATEAEAKDYFHSSAAFFNEVVHNQHSVYPPYSNARLGSLFLPSFIGLRYGCAPPPAVRIEQRQGLSVLMTDVRRAPIHQLGHEDNHTPCFTAEDERAGVLNKLAFFAVCLDGGIDILPVFRARLLREGRRSPKYDAIIKIENNIFPVKVSSAPSAQNQMKLPPVTISFSELAYRANHRAGSSKLLRGTRREIRDLVIQQLEQGAGIRHSGRQNNPKLLIDRMIEDVRSHFRIAEAPITL